MPRSDYDHWNEDADHMWWMEEGRFGSERDPNEAFDDLDFDPTDPDMEVFS